MSRSPGLNPGEFQKLLQSTKHELRVALAQEEIDNDQLSDLITRLNVLRYLVQQEKEKAS